MTTCHACGKPDCPSKADPKTGPFTRHNAAAYAALLARRYLPARIPPRPPPCTCGASWCPWTLVKETKPWWRP